MKKLLAIILIILTLSVTAHANVFWNSNEDYVAHIPLQAES